MPDYRPLWERDYDERTLECTTARIAVALEPTPRTWPISGPLGKWNPQGHPLSEPIPPSDPLGRFTELDDTA